MRYKSVAKRKIIELEETLDYSDGQAVGFGSTKGRDGLGRPDIRGVAPHGGEFSRMRFRSTPSTASLRLQPTTTPTVDVSKGGSICDAIWLS